MSVQFATSMANPTDSASKDPVNPDTAQTRADATARAPTEPDTTPSLKADAEPSSDLKAEAHSAQDKTLDPSPTLVCADPADRQKGAAGPVEQNSTADSSRRSSAGSLRFDIPQRPGLPRGDSRGINGRRIRNASPPPAK